MKTAENQLLIFEGARAGRYLQRSRPIEADLSATPSCHNGLYAIKSVLP